MKIIQRYDNEAFRVEKRGPGVFSHRITCCDCGLVHDFAFILDKGQLHVAAKRNNRSTAARRRGMK